MCVACSPGVSVLARGLGVAAGGGFALASADAGAGAVAGSSRHPEPAIVLHGGPILTMDRTRPRVQALAVRGDTLVAAGTREEVRRAAGAGARLLDLGGRAVLPGFVEPHVHLIMSSLAAHWWLDVSPIARPSREAVLAAVHEASAAARDSWVVGFGYDPSRLPPDYPELGADDLDVAAGDVPVFIVNQSGHIAYVNHAALNAAGVGDATPDPPAGSYVRDDAGRLTGVLHESPSYAPFLASLPLPSAQEIAGLAATTLRDWAAQGCTTVYDAGVGMFDAKGDAALLRTLATAADAPLRVRGALVPEAVDALGARPGAGDERFNLVGVKFWADGSTQGFTGAVVEPFPGEKGAGTLNYEEADLLAAMARFHAAGWQLLVHSNGDRATDQVLRVYAELLSAQPLVDVRHRIEHFTVGREDQIAAAASLGLSVSHTIGHVHYWGASFRDHVLGRARAQRIHALRSDLANGIVSSCHSDSPVTPVNPRLYARTAATRLIRGGDEVLGPDQTITVEEALETITINPAHHVLLDDRVGSLVAGKLADLVVLDRDPLTVPAERIDELAVLETWVGGRRQVWG